MRRPALAVGLTLAAALTLVSGAGATPMLGAAFGHTFAITGDATGGGPAIQAWAMWPLDVERLSLGFALTANDLGSDLAQIRDRHDGVALGTSEQRQREAYGLSWRMEAQGPRALGGAPWGAGSWGAYAVTDSRLGQRLHSTGSTGFGLEGGLRWGVGDHGALGFAVRYHRLSNDVAGRYMSAGLDWTWHGAR